MVDRVAGPRGAPVRVLEGAGAAVVVAGAQVRAAPVGLACAISNPRWERRENTGKDWRETGLRVVGE